MQTHPYASSGAPRTFCETVMGSNDLLGHILDFVGTPDKQAWLRPTSKSFDAAFQEKRHEHIVSYLKPNLHTKSTEEALALFRNPANHKYPFLQEWYAYGSLQDHASFLNYFLRHDGYFTEHSDEPRYEHENFQKISIFLDHMRNGRFPLIAVMEQFIPTSFTSYRPPDAIRPHSSAAFFAACVASKSPDWKKNTALFESLQKKFPDFLKRECWLHNDYLNDLNTLFEDIRCHFDGEKNWLASRTHTRNFFRKNSKNLQTNFILFQKLLRSLEFSSQDQKKYVFDIFFYQFFLLRKPPFCLKNEENFFAQAAYVENLASSIRHDLPFLEAHLIFFHDFIKVIFEPEIINKDLSELSLIKNFVASRIEIFQEKMGKVAFLYQSDAEKITKNTEKICEKMLEILSFYTSNLHKTYPIFLFQNALENGQEGVVDCILQRNPAIVQEKNPLGFGALETAIFSGNPHFIERFLHLPALNLNADLAGNSYSYLQSPLLLMICIDNFAGFQFIYQKIGAQEAFKQLFVYGWLYEEPTYQDPAQNIWQCTRLILDCVKTNPMPYVEILLATLQQVYNNKYVLAELEPWDSGTRLTDVLPMHTFTEHAQNQAPAIRQYAQVLQAFLDAGLWMPIFNDLKVEAHQLVGTQFIPNKTNLGLNDDEVYLDTNFLGLFAYFGEIKLLKRLLHQGLSLPAEEITGRISLNELACAIIGQQYQTVTFFLTGQDAGDARTALELEEIAVLASKDAHMENICQSNLWGDAMEVDGDVDRDSDGVDTANVDMNGSGVGVANMDSESDGNSEYAQIYIESALHLAAKVGNVDITALLLRHGADRDALESVYGETPLETAIRWHGEAHPIVRLLRRK